MIIADTDFGEQPNVDLRRLRRWRKSVMRCQKDQRYLVEPAITPQDFAESMRLVHDSFVESGYVRPYEYGLRLADFLFIFKAAIDSFVHIIIHGG